MNHKVKSAHSYFCNQPLIELKDEYMKEEVFKSIQTIGTYNIEAKYYQFLTFKNLNQLKNSEFMISMTSFGKKFSLYLKKIGTKNYCIFLNKKSKQCILAKHTFALSLFEGTFMDGELIKNSRNEWFFMIDDLIYYEGANMITEKYETRKSKLKYLLEHQYKYDVSNHCKLLMKEYVQVKYLNDYVQVYIPKLSYKCSGLIFKSTYNFSDNYTYIFPECRTDTQILGGKVEEEKREKVLQEEKKVVEIEKVVVKEEEDEDLTILDILGAQCEVHHYEEEDEEEDDDEKSEENQEKSEEKREVIDLNTYCKFLVKSTHAPDIYELYCRSASGNVEKYGYAAIPNMATSSMMRKLFLDEKSEVIMRCRYHKIFKKWYPYETHHKKSNDAIDHLYRINKVKIILDKMEDDDI